ncbi:MAG: hypothetical protein IT340_01190 [Chloroflexi bacterium]|nr:hypothetical protein [Chloroflexota bacterium]
MQDVMDQRWTDQNRPTSMGASLVRLPETGRFVLEDHAGYPIDCPLCGRADGWRMEREPGSTVPRAFACRHVVPDAHGGRARLSAAVSADQVGGYLDPLALLSTAA